jgi:hypothetical protein
MFAREQTRPGEAAWPGEVGMDRAPWRPGFPCRLPHLVVAGLASSCTVVVLGLLISRFPELFGRPVARAVFFTGPGFDLQKPALALLASAAIVYWGLALVRVLPTFRGGSPVGSYAARVLSTLAAGLLGFVLPLLAVIWTLASALGAVPEGPWGVAQGNHGPWRRILDLRALVDLAISLPCYSLLLGRLSFMIKPSREGGYVMVVSVLVFLALVWSHYWLID